MELGWCMNGAVKSLHTWPPKNASVFPHRKKNSSGSAPAQLMPTANVNHKASSVIIAPFRALPGRGSTNCIWPCSTNMA
jgi:hypothetical protein